MNFSLLNQLRSLRNQKSEEPAAPLGPEAGPAGVTALHLSSLDPYDVCMYAFMCARFYAV